MRRVAAAFPFAAIAAFAMLMLPGYASAANDDAQRTLYIACENAQVHYLLKIPYDVFLPSIGKV